MLARSMAAHVAVESDWLSEEYATCTEITVDGTEGILIESNTGG